jgi:sterol desaturase/sphingolipid hydroxylase (fatty acid hydroxylase superfamily)
MTGEHAFGVDWRIAALPIIVGWGALMVALERVLPHDRGQRLFRVGLFTDFFWYTVVQSYVLGLAIALLIRALDDASGVSRLHLVTGWPVAAQLALFFVTHDLYIYWFHRLQHSSPVLWRIHEAHHSVKDVDFVAGSRSHPLEILVNQTVEYAPIVLLGAHPDVALVKGVLDATWGMWIHSNVGVRTGPLQYVLNGPEMHRWHHSSRFTGVGFNFGTKLAIWDWLFGTAYLPYLRETAIASRAELGDVPRGYGLADEPAFPEETTRLSLVTTYFKQITWAFRRSRERDERALWTAPDRLNLPAPNRGESP